MQQSMYKLQRPGWQTAKAKVNINIKVKLLRRSELKRDEKYMHKHIHIQCVGYDRSQLFL